MPYYKVRWNEETTLSIVRMFILNLYGGFSNVK